MPRTRTLVSLAAATALLVPGAILSVGSAQAALPKAPGVTIPAALPSKATVGGLSVENSFVSSLGWVKPGDSYPSRFVIKNPTAGTLSGISIQLPQTRGMEWVSASANFGTANLAGGVVSWTVPSLLSGSGAALVLEAEADTFAEDATVVWRNIASTATVTVGSATAKVRSHGPKVIPPSGGYETARFGDRPFPVVPIDFADFKHAQSAAELDRVINSPANPSSTYSLYQEMSFGQLFPHGTIGSVALKDKDYSSDPEPLKFTTIDPTKITTCTGVTAVDPSSGEPTAAYTKRITDGWYQLPGQRNYYGADGNGSALVGAIGGVGALQNIDSGCGPAGKAAYDAAVVADPDIDYSDFDTDKDGVVDFFEVIFQGCGGHGESQEGPVAGCAATDTGDNIWPHSSSLESYYTDPVTGLSGYISKDQLKDLEGRPLWYTDDSYTTKTTVDKGAALKVFVRVGPYNVNPENSIEHASVISHEYGHSLGLPDYYSTGSRDTYGDFTLMATDKSQHMDVIGKKELGWVVPKVLPRGTSKATNWRDSKLDTGEIEWVTPDGRPYTLKAGTDQEIHNAEAYVVALPGRQLVDPAVIKSGASGKRVWYSRQGNDFGCVPTGGHNLDIVIPGLGNLPANTPVTATFKSLWDIEWDYDYGFVLTGVPDEKGKVTYASVASEEGYTTPSTQNPNTNSCLSKFSNGITGTSGSYALGTQDVDRVASVLPAKAPVFLQDSYDLSSLAGKAGSVLRFSYATDPGLAKLGWIIDDLKITATVAGNEKVLFSSDFEDGDGGPNDARVFPGGCKEDLSVSGGVCTEGWTYLEAGTPSSQEHAYLLEMRDRSGFDVDGRGESDRGATAFTPGVLLTYTDEAHGYGNVGTDNPPAQSPLDSKPTPEDDTPNLNDATFGDGAEYTDSKATPHTDNYDEPTRDATKDTDADGAQPWVFDYDCLKFEVTKLAGETDNNVNRYDLVGDATFTTAGGCARFNYGFAAESVVPPAIGGPGLPVDRAPTGGGLPATGGLGAPGLAALALIGAGVLARRRYLLG